MTSRPMLEIPVSAAKDIADRYGYDQIVIIARRVGDEPDPHGEHVTTYGRDKAHCGVAARVGNYIKHKIMGWPEYVPADMGATQAATEADVLMGYMHPGNFHWQQRARWERGDPCAIRKNGWKNYEFQVPVYAKKTDVDAAIAAQAKAQEGAL